MFDFDAITRSLLVNICWLMFVVLLEIPDLEIMVGLCKRDPYNGLSWSL